MLTTTWTKHLPKDKKDEFRKVILAARPVLERLKVLLEEDLVASQKEQLGKVNYKDTSWPMYQADCIGEQRTLNKIIKLITLDEEK
jgi:hypothetical protein